MRGIFRGGHRDGQTYQVPEGLDIVRTPKPVGQFGVETYTVGEVRRDDDGEYLELNLRGGE